MRFMLLSSSKVIHGLFVCEYCMSLTLIDNGSVCYDWCQWHFLKQSNRLISQIFMHKRMTMIECLR